MKLLLLVLAVWLPCIPGAMLGHTGDSKKTPDITQMLKDAVAARLQPDCSANGTSEAFKNKFWIQIYKETDCQGEPLSRPIFHESFTEGYSCYHNRLEARSFLAKPLSVWSKLKDFAKDKDYMIPLPIPAHPGDELLFWKGWNCTHAQYVERTTLNGAKDCFTFNQEVNHLGFGYPRTCPVGVSAPEEEKDKDADRKLAIFKTRSGDDRVGKIKIFGSYDDSLILRVDKVTGILPPKSFNHA